MGERKKESLADLYIPVAYDSEKQKFVVDQTKKVLETEVQKNSNQSENRIKEKNYDDQINKEPRKSIIEQIRSWMGRDRSGRPRI